MSPQHELCVHMYSKYIGLYVYVCTVNSINTQLTSLQPHTAFHRDMTLPHSTAGSEVPLQLAEALGEAILTSRFRLTSLQCLLGKYRRRSC